MNLKKNLAYLVIILAFYQFAIFLYYSFKAIYKHFFVRELNLAKRYGKGSYVIITGPSSGQGKHFAYEFAKRGFNLILIGSERTKAVTNDLQNKYKSIKIITIIKNFCNAAENDFFLENEEAIDSVNVNISILVNNVGHRTAWDPYHEMPKELITNTIIVGTVVQSHLTRICLPYFIKRKQKNCIKFHLWALLFLFVTA